MVGKYLRKALGIASFRGDDKILPFDKKRCPRVLNSALALFGTSFLPLMGSLD